MGEPVSRKEHSQWGSSLWACFSPLDLCFMANCCCCVPYGKASEMLSDNSGDLKGYSGCGADCCIFAIVSYFGCCGLMAYKQRRDIEKRFNMEGHNGCVDFLAACCCTACVLVQHNKELDERFEAVRLLQQPRAQQQMAYMPQGQQPMAYPPQSHQPGHPQQQYIQSQPQQQYITQGSPQPQQQQPNVQYGLREKADYNRNAI